MTAAELTAHADDRHPWDWYIDETWCTDALVRTLGFEAFDGQHIHDPCCGRGTIPHYFDQYGFSASGGDVEDRRGAYGFPVGDWRFAVHDFYRIATLPPAFVGLPPAQAELPRRKLSIVFNPPYTLQDNRIIRGLTSHMVARAISLATHKVCVLVPSKWLSSDQRYQLFQRHMPAAIIMLMERPSMPPGHLIGDMGGNAFRGGKADYCWVVFDNQVETAPGETHIFFVAPRDAATKARERGR